MKTIILSLIAIALVSCSKSKEDTTPAVTITPRAFVVDNRHWAVAIGSDQAITSTGTVTVSWNVHGTGGGFMYERTATVPYSFNGSMASNYEVTDIIASGSMTARNVRVISISGTGGYTFK